MKRIAIIGGGVSGLAALWSLNEYSEHETHLYESAKYIGGHTNTVRYKPTEAASQQYAGGAGLEEVDVDTGFIVFNTVTYPNFLRFINLVGVKILTSDMSFSVSRYGYPRVPNSLSPLNALLSAIGGSSGDNDNPSTKTGVQSITQKGQAVDQPVRGDFEWAGGSPAGLFCQKTNYLNPSHWRMIWDIIRFNNQSLETLRAFEKGKGKGEMEEGSIGQWLDQRGYGEGFRRNYLIPMTASIWSTPPSLAFSSFPAITLLRFMHNHHLLQILNRPQWLTLKGGSGNYVRRVLAQVPKERVHHNANDDGKGSGNVVAVKQSGDGAWSVKTADGGEERYDEVVFATHADISLALLDGALQSGDSRRDILSRFEFSKNEAVLHGDERLMPVRRAAWSAWNFIAEEAPHSTSSEVQRAGTASATSISSSQDTDRVSLTYWMNLLQSLPRSSHGPVLVTLNPPIGPGAAPREDLIAARFSYHHPIYTPASVSAQKALKPLQGKDGLHFAGAWLNYGFHEDGFTSGLKVGQRLGASLPFAIQSAERDLPPVDLSLLLIEGCEAIRRRIAGPMIRGLYPLILLVSLLMEFLIVLFHHLFGIVHPAPAPAPAPAGRSKVGQSNLSSHLRRIRVDWEKNATE